MLLEKNREYLAEAGCAIEEVADEDRLCRHMAEQIANGNGKVIGRFQGRMDGVPRALGN